jgi:hypothetical protein
MDRITARHCRRSDRRRSLQVAIGFLDLTAPVADVERSSDVDDRGLAGPEAAQDVLGL